MCSPAFRQIALVAIVLSSVVGTADATPRVPDVVARLLERTGVPRDAVDALLAPSDRPLTATVDTGVATVMHRARREDVVVDLGQPVFDKPQVELGAWKSAAFLDSYGTALFLTEPWDRRRTPVLLVHGINGSPRDFGWIAERFRGTAYQPVVFFYPSGMALADASEQLSARLGEFVARHPANDLAMIGHSMGGLVVKAMLDRGDVSRRIPSGKIFIAISSPWAGMPIAKHGRQLSHHPACWDDLVPTSQFMRDVNATPFPRQVAFYMFFGAKSDPSPLAVLGNNDGRLTIDGMMKAPVVEQARDVYGFYEGHTSILESQRVFDRIITVLGQELARG